MISRSRLNTDNFHLCFFMLILIIIRNPNVVGHLDDMVNDNLSIRC